jgi:hypothetical protein
MGDRAVLGPADVSDDELLAMVADWCGRDRADVELLESCAEVVPYDQQTITTAGRYWVRGSARTPDGPLRFSFFVKHVQSWSRSPEFAQVPDEFREMAEAGVPWRTEPLIYRSDLAERLPPGLSMPRVIAVRDLDPKSAAVWLEEVPVKACAWTGADLGHAAYLLGRLAGRPAVRALAAIGETERAFPVRSYVEGRLNVQILPMLRGAEIWRHPLVGGAFDTELRQRLLDAADRVPSFLAELEGVPNGTAHGDACTNNLLVQRDSDDLVLIDYSFWTVQPVGFDLGQLLLGDVQLGRRPASGLADAEAVCLPAYVEGLSDEGCAVPASVVRRAHALQMLIFSGLSAFPLEHLGAIPTAELHRLASERAALATFILDLVDATERSSEGSAQASATT